MIHFGRWKLSTMWSSKKSFSTDIISCLSYCGNGKYRLNVIGVYACRSKYFSFIMWSFLSFFSIIEILLTGFFMLSPIFTDHRSLFRSLQGVINLFFLENFGYVLIEWLPPYFLVFSPNTDTIFEHFWRSR